jgi:hypothetical protein
MADNSSLDAALTVRYDVSHHRGRSADGADRETVGAAGRD